MQLCTVQCVPVTQWTSWPRLFTLRSRLWEPPLHYYFVYACALQLDFPSDMGTEILGEAQAVRGALRRALTGHECVQDLHPALSCEQIKLLQLSILNAFDLRAFVLS